jgi:hypothetical protein
MNTRKMSWSYSLCVDEAVRISALSAGVSFVHIAERIASDMTVLCCHRSEIEGTDFKRPVYTVFVGLSLFDLFFNSKVGYRAAYFQSPGIGLDANVLLMRAVASRLVADPLSAGSELPPDFIRESLVTPSAKAWLAEHSKELDQKCPGCEGEWSSGSAGPAEQAEILNRRWETTSGQKAEWGRKAPYLTKLRLMGAFINERHHELVPFDKRFRAYEIHQFGWS